jgi:hypothetical protein
VYRKKHTDQLKNLMVDIVSVILAEYETIPFSLLELLFSRIIDPEKVLLMFRQKIGKFEIYFLEIT